MPDDNDRAQETGGPDQAETASAEPEQTELLGHLHERLARMSPAPTETRSIAKEYARSGVPPAEYAGTYGAVYDELVSAALDTVRDALPEETGTHEELDDAISEAEGTLRQGSSLLVADLQSGLRGYEAVREEAEDTHWARGDAGDSRANTTTGRLVADANLDVETLVESIPMPAFVLDDEHTLISYNFGLAKLLGVGPQEALGKDYRDVVSYAVYADGRRELSLADKVVNAPRSAAEQYDVARVDSSNEYTHQYVYEDTSTVVNRRGEKIDIAFIAVPIFDDGDDLLGVLEIAQDRVSELEEFPGLAGVMSHDLRNPLDVLWTYTELSEDAIDPDYYEKMERNLRRIERIIDDVLVLSRQAAADPDRKRVDAAQVAEAAWMTVETEGANLETDAVTVDTDQSQLQQVFENLFRNAIEHAGPAVTVRVGPAEDGFYVADDGPGIDPNRRGKVFEHGFSTADEGTGFGLSIVQEIVRNHGWEITVTESASGGARFEIATDIEG